MMFGRWWFMVVLVILDSDVKVFVLNVVIGGVVSVGMRLGRMMLECVVLVSRVRRVVRVLLVFFLDWRRLRRKGRIWLIVCLLRICCSELKVLVVVLWIFLLVFVSVVWMIEMRIFL